MLERGYALIYMIYADFEYKLISDHPLNLCHPRSPNINLILTTFERKIGFHARRTSLSKNIVSCHRA